MDSNSPLSPERKRLSHSYLTLELLIQKLKPKGEHECGLLRKIFSYNSNHLGIFYLQLECMYFLKRLWQAGDEFFVSKLIH